MNKRRLIAALSVLALGSFPFLARAGDEAAPDPEAMNAEVPAPIQDFGFVFSPIPINDINASLDTFPQPGASPVAISGGQSQLSSDLEAASQPQSLPIAAVRPAQESAGVSAPTTAKTPLTLAQSIQTSEKELSIAGHGLQPSLKAAANGDSSADMSVQAGEHIQEILDSEQSIGGAAAIEPADVLAARGSSGGGFYHSGTVWMPAHPSEFYKDALAQAVETSGRYGVKPENVHLGEVKGVFSSHERHELGYEFYMSPGKSEKGSGMIYVDFSRDWAAPGQRMGSRAATFITGPMQHEVAPRYVDADEFGKKVIYSPWAAFEVARKKFPKLSLNASYSLRLDRRDGGKDFWYHIYDSHGNAVAVNAITAETVDIGKKP